MLKNKLYTILALTTDEKREKISALISLNKDHAIFGGHFPGNPILPGVCTVQIVKELLETSFGSELMLRKASNIKYLGFVSPTASPEVQFNLLIRDHTAGVLTCSANVTAGGNAVCSFRGEYVEN